MAGHAQLKFVMTECSNAQIRLTGLILLIFLHVPIVHNESDCINILRALSHQNSPDQILICNKEHTFSTSPNLNKNL